MQRHAGRGAVLTPCNAVSCGRVWQWLELCQGDLGTIVLVLTELNKFEFTAEQRAAAEADALQRLQSKLEALDDTLASRTFLVTERPTLADVAIASVLHPIYAQLLDSKVRTAAPHLTRWFLTCMEVVRGCTPALWLVPGAAATTLTAATCGVALQDAFKQVLGPAAPMFSL